MHAIRKPLYQRLIIILLLCAAIVIVYPAASGRPSAAAATAPPREHITLPPGAVQEELYLRHPVVFGTAAVPAVSAAPASMTTAVEPGEGLSQVSQRVYGSAAWWPELLSANPKIGGFPYMLQIGEILVVPPKDATAPSQPAGIVVTSATVTSSGPAPAAVAPASAGSLQAYALQLLGGDQIQYSCLSSIIMIESSWNVYASNPSGAYGIPQALPGSKMAAAGSDWATDGDTQLRWMIQMYIPGTYGTACNAWAHEQEFGWY